MSTTLGGREIVDCRNKRLILPSGGLPAPEIASEGQVSIEGGSLCVFIDGVWSSVAITPVPMAPSEELVGQFTATPGDNRIHIANHGLLNDDEVKFKLGAEPTNALPTPLAVGTSYFVISSRINDFQVASAKGGPAVVITDAGVGGTNECWKQTLVPTVAQKSTQATKSASKSGK